MSRKVIVLLGSPRKNGNTETLAASFSNGAGVSGYKISTLRIAGLKIGGCIDCRRCWTGNGHCFLNDDMKEIYAAIDDAEVITFVSPLYFYSWSAQIKPVWDRLLPYFSANSKIDVSGRRAVLISAAGDNDASCFDGLKKSFELSCNFAKWEIAGEILVPGLYEAGAASKKQECLDAAFRAGNNL
jgi:multimeric flavodoxin WrbA